jgi:hypothetical protein
VRQAHAHRKKVLTLSSHEAGTEGWATVSITNNKPRGNGEQCRMIALIRRHRSGFPFVSMTLYTTLLSTALRCGSLITHQAQTEETCASTSHDVLAWRRARGLYEPLSCLRLVAHAASSLVVSWPREAASLTERSTASGCKAIQSEADSSD